MPDKFKIVTTILVLEMIDTIRVHRKNKKIWASNQQKYDDLLEIAQTFGKQAEYLNSLLVQNGIEVTEFDLIAISNL